LAKIEKEKMKEKALHDSQMIKEEDEDIQDLLEDNVEIFDEEDPDTLPLNNQGMVDQPYPVE
jgi:uncharacterized protein YaaN involved in tellurite resistance